MLAQLLVIRIVGLNLYGLLLLDKGTKYAIVAIDYYTKWVKVIPLRKIIEN